MVPGSSLKVSASAWSLAQYPFPWGKPDIEMEGLEMGMGKTSLLWQLLAFWCSLRIQDMDGQRHQWSATCLLYQICLVPLFSPIHYILATIAFSQFLEYTIFFPISGLCICWSLNLEYLSWTLKLISFYCLEVLILNITSSKNPSV